MSFVSSIFKSETKKNWKQLASEIGADFVDGGIWDSDKIILKYRKTNITLDTYNQNNRKSGYVNTRIRCPFVTINEFQFNITSENTFSHAGKIFGLKDLEINNAKFDNEFYLKSRYKDKLILFLDSEIIQNVYLEFAKNEIIGLEISITEDKPFFSLQKNPSKVFWICCEKMKLESDIEILKQWFTLCKLTFDRLIEIGEAEDVSPNI